MWLRDFPKLSVPRQAASIFFILFSLGCQWVNAESGFTRRVLCGNTISAYTDHFGYTWATDRPYVGNTDLYPWGYLAASNSASFSGQLIENTNEWMLFLSECWGDSPTPAYRFDVPGPGTYYLKVLFAENYFNTPASRRFNLRINGQQLLADYDIMSDAHGRSRRAVIKQFVVAITPSDPSTIEILTEKIPGFDNPKINALELSTNPTLTDTIDHYDRSAPNGEEALRINCGGTRSIDPDGTLWMPDEAFAHCLRWGFIGGNEHANVLIPWDTSAHIRSATWRAGDENMAYRFHLPNGRYFVKLFFSENEYTNVGQRVFDVSLNKKLIASHFDIFAQAGYANSCTLEGTVQLGNEDLSVEFPHIFAGEAIINAVEILALQVADNDFIDFVERRSMHYFTNSSGPFQTVNPSNGLIVDMQTNFFDTSWRKPCSIAGLGFGLAALCAGANRGWIDASEAQNYLAFVLKTFSDAPSYVSGDEPGITQKEGFFFHLIKMATGQREWNSEISSVDSSLLFAGVLTAMRAFPSGAVYSHASQILSRINWPWFVNGHPQGFLSMGWNPDDNTFQGTWSKYNEGPIVDILALSSDAYPVSPKCWFNLTPDWIDRLGSIFEGEWIDGGPLGLFTQIYPQCFADLRGTFDAKNDYFFNTRQAVLDNRNYCLGLSASHLTYSQGGWGISACVSPQNGWNYIAYQPKSGGDTGQDGTVNPPIVGASVPFAPEVAIPELRRLYFQYKHFLWGRFGFADAYNLNAPQSGSKDASGTGWVSPDVIALDHGCMITALDNYRTGYIWRMFTQAPSIQKSYTKMDVGNYIVDDFDNDRSLEDAPDQRDAFWSRSSETVFYGWETRQNIFGNPTTCLHVQYNKPDATDWPNLSVGNLSQPANMSYWLGRGKLNLRICGNGVLRFKFLCEGGPDPEHSCESPDFTIESPNEWQNLVWDYSGMEWGLNDPRRVKQILIFVQPGKTGSGEFYLDDLMVKPGISITPVSTATPSISPPISSATASVTSTRTDYSGGERMVAFPNPAKGPINFAWKNRPIQAVKVEIYNISGQLVCRIFEVSPRSNMTVWDTRGVAAGIYFYRIFLTMDGREEAQGVKKVAIVR